MSLSSSSNFTCTRRRRNEFQSGGTQVQREARKKFLSCPSTFLALQVQLVVLGSAIVTVSTVWFAVFLLTVPAVPYEVAAGACRCLPRIWKQPAKPAGRLHQPWIRTAKDLRTLNMGQYSGWRGSQHLETWRQRVMKTAILSRVGIAIYDDEKDDNLDDDNFT